MIEINLSPGDRDKDLTRIAGINLSLINVKLLIPFFLLVYLVEPAIDSYYIEEIAQQEELFTTRNNKMRKIRAQLSTYDGVKNQVKELNAKELDLEKKIIIVKEIVDKRQNPFKALKYIAENTPKDVWLMELEIDDRKVKMIGYSKSWKSIGDFIDNLKNSLFFDGNVNYTKPDELLKEIGNNRVEGFEINTTIASFN